MAAGVRKTRAMNQSGIIACPKLDVEGPSGALVFQLWSRLSTNPNLPKNESLNRLESPGVAGDVW